jgi:hypothetical protein
LCFFAFSALLLPTSLQDVSLEQVISISLSMQWSI